MKNLLFLMRFLIAAIVRWRKVGLSANMAIDKIYQYCYIINNRTKRCMGYYRIILMEEVEDFLGKIEDRDSAKIYTQISSMEQGDFSELFIRTLHSPLKELKMEKYRILFFIYKDRLCIVSAFIKKSQKTPRKELARAQNIIRLFMQKL